ncbi:MAG: hypothetical protein HN576_06980 [Bacteriovoracaceae bacterium]|jgi:hypothetical protein|nr:hypothetical protein [Bacteriovoracaceae bacterium]
MGKISASLKKNLLLHINKKVVDISSMREAKKIAVEATEHLKSLDDELSSGERDPLQHAYISTISFMSTCMYGLANLKEMKAFKKVSKEQEDLYMPSFPPMSPITDSYYVPWEMLDLRFGPDKETLSSIFLDLADSLKIDQDQIELLKNLSNSRMGIYEVVKKDGKKILLKEILTNKEYWSVCTAGYKGKIGQLWYVRLLPGITEYVDYSLVMTTPYVLLTHKKESWLSFFKDHKVTQFNYHNFMKFGPSLNFWNEFIFYGFCNFIDQAVFLSGLPDQMKTLPCSDDFIESNALAESFGTMLLQADIKKMMQYRSQQQL